jgi:hypothetical protein
MAMVWVGPPLSCGPSPGSLGLASFLRGLLGEGAVVVVGDVAAAVGDAPAIPALEAVGPIT